MLGKVREALTARAVAGLPLQLGELLAQQADTGAEGAAVDDYTDATVTWDPTNPPMLYDFEADDLTNDEYLSHVYVPWDAE